MSWPMVALGEAANLSWGNTSITKDSYQAEGFDAYSAAGMDGKLAHFEFDQEGVVLSAIGARCGRCFWAEGKWVAIKNTITIVPNESKTADARFLFHCLGRDGVWPKRGGAQPFIGLGDARLLKIPLPPLIEQCRIAAILDKADALRTKRREAIAKLDQLLQSVFLEMFGGSTTATTSVAELAPAAGAIRTGPFGSQLLHSEFVEQGIAVLGIDNAVSNTFAWAKPRFITAEKYAQLARYRVNPGDVLITIMGTCGRCAVVPDGVPTAINTKHLCCITLDTTRCEPEFLHSYFLMHPVARSYLESRAKGAIMAGLNMGIIKELPVALPSIEEQRRFVTIKKSLEKQRVQAVSQENRSDELFAALQQNAFAGTL